MTENMETLGLATILKDLEDVISNATRLPLSSKVLVDGDAILEIVDKIYESLPDEVKKAQKVLEHSDKLLETVEGQSKRILNEAREQANQMTQDTEIYREAAERAQSMMTQAETASAQLRHESLMYCDDVLRQLGDNIEHVLNSIYQNREDLKSFKYYNLDDQA